MRRAAIAALVATAALATACGRDFGPPSGQRSFVSVPLRLSLELSADVPTFKVDARLRLVWEFADQPVGGSDLGIVTLPAGERRTTFDLDVPSRPGRLVVREETFTPRAPFLCASTGLLDARETPSATVVLSLCQPE